MLIGLFDNLHPLGELTIGENSSHQSQWSENDCNQPARYLVDIFNALLERLFGFLESRSGQTQSVFPELPFLENPAKTNTSAVWSHT